MKKSLVFALTAAVMVFSSCSANYNTVKRMQKLEEGVDHPTTKEELLEAIKKYDERAMDLVAAQAQEGIWYKILGTRYLDERMYTKAYEAFQQALYYYPDNANIYYYLAICAGYIANTQMDFEANGGIFSQQKKMNYLMLSEEAYLQALSIDPKYYRAMYGIGVLYEFELGESEKAIPYLEEFLRTQTKDINGMMVLARSYYSTGQYSKAIAVYDRLIELKPTNEVVDVAEKNKAQILADQYNIN